ncbi:MAG: hypothetical protein RI947_1194 [Candidatus Parcubacteria bacterium]|jgi:hypothetical protein
MKTQHQRGRLPQAVKHTGRWITIAVVCVIAITVVALFSLRNPEQPPQTTASSQTSAAPQPKGHFMDPNDLRIVKIAPKNAPMVLDEGGTTVAVVNLLEGNIPAGATKATVKTDEDCAPDESGPTKGWSHCHNRVVFDDGTEAVVQHHHKIAEVGCFTPNQVIKIG